MANNQQKQLLTFRYSLLAEAQLKFLQQPLPEPKGKVILEALWQNGNDREFKYFGSIYSFVGFREITPSSNSTFPANRFWVGKFAKLKKTETGQRVPGDIIGYSQDDWVGLVTIFDTESQHIFVEKNWKFGKPEQFERAMQVGLLAPILAKFNYKIFVKAKSNVQHFWNLVSESINLYKLELKLISPNILETNKKAREALSDLKKIFSQDQIEISLKNDSGDLKIPIKPIADYIDYIGEGEGSWKLTQKKFGGRKQTVSSFENIDIVNIPIENFPSPEIGIDLTLEERALLARKKETNLIDTIYSLFDR